MNEAMNTRNAPPGWWLVTSREPNESLSLLCAILAVVWLGAVVVRSRRG
jgi:hypothetical protein